MISGRTRHWEISLQERLQGSLIRSTVEDLRDTLLSPPDWIDRGGSSSWVTQRRQNSSGAQTARWRNFRYLLRSDPSLSLCSQDNTAESGGAAHTLRAKR